MMFRPARLAATALLALSAIATAAHAERAPTRVNTVKVAYSDLDLRNEGDVQVMLERLERAAFDACGGKEQFHPAFKQNPQLTTKVFRECREGAMSRAIAEVDSHELATAYQSKRA